MRRFAVVNFPNPWHKTIFSDSFYTSLLLDISAVLIQHTDNVQSAHVILSTDLKRVDELSSAIKAF